MARKIQTDLFLLETISNPKAKLVDHLPITRSLRTTEIDDEQMEKLFDDLRMRMTALSIEQLEMRTTSGEGSHAQFDNVEYDRVFEDVVVDAKLLANLEVVQGELVRPRFQE